MGEKETNKKTQNMAKAAGGSPVKPSGKKKNIWVFPAIVTALYAVLYVFYPSKTLSALSYAGKMATVIAPVLLLVLLFIFLFNLIDEKWLKKTVEESPIILQYLAMAFFGTLSHGPIYAWYPLMGQFREKGVAYGPISVFLYARGIKLSLLPMLALYFGAGYAAALTASLAVFSIIQGLLVDTVMKNNA